MQGTTMKGQKSIEYFDYEFVMLLFGTGFSNQ